MKSLKYFLALAITIGLLVAPDAYAVEERSFTIYAFLPWSHHRSEDGRIVQQPKLTDYLKQLNIQPVWVIYDNRYMSEWEGNETDQVKVRTAQGNKNINVIDEEKIKQVALAALNDPSIPVSFDTELGHRFRPDTVIPGVLEVLRLFKKYNDKNLVGVYATAPQVMYQWDKNSVALLNELSLKYEAVAMAADFLSPVMYYRKNQDLDDWKNITEYSIHAAQAYKQNKPIIPYISFNYKDQSEASEQDALARLTYLYEHGANGCIVWGASADRAIFDRNVGWSKALVDFALAHKK